MKKNNEEPEKENSERWLLTYSDLITLLLVFFIILYSISSVDKQKFESVISSLRQTFTGGSYSGGNGSGNGNGTGTGNDIIPSESSSPSSQPSSSPSATGGGYGNGWVTENDEMNKALIEIAKLIKEYNLENNLNVGIEKRGLVVSIKSHVLFDSGVAQINSDSMELMDRIGKLFEPLSNHQIRVEGHTDNVPINTSQYPSNWELSSARATNVLQYLIPHANLDPSKVSAVGYGEFRPKYPNDTAENRAKNRRVDIVIVKEEYSIVDDF